MERSCYTLSRLGFQGLFGSTFLQLLSTNLGKIIYLMFCKLVGWRPELKCQVSKSSIKTEEKEGTRKK